MVSLRGGDSGAANDWAGDLPRDAEIETEMALIRSKRKLHSVKLGECISPVSNIVSSAVRQVCLFVTLSLTLYLFLSEFVSLLSSAISRDRPYPVYRENIVRDEAISML